MTRHIIDGRKTEVDSHVGHFLASLPKEGLVFFDNCAAGPVYPGWAKHRLVTVPYSERPLWLLKDEAGRLACLLDFFYEHENLLTVSKVCSEFSATTNVIYKTLLGEQNTARKKVYRRVLERRYDFFDLLTRPEGIADSKKNMTDEDF